MNNFFIVSKPSVSKNVGKINYARFNNTPVPPMSSPKAVVALAKVVKEQVAIASSGHINIKPEVKAVSGISHLITKKHKVKQYRKVTGIAHLLEDAK